MIKLVIKALENNIRKQYPNVILILEKYNEQCKIKAFQKYKYILWYKKDVLDDPVQIIRTELIDRVTSEEEKSSVEELIQLKFLDALFEYLKGDVIWKN